MQRVRMRREALKQEMRQTEVSPAIKRRALYKALALHQDIPAAYYQAVAGIIRYVYTLQGKTLGT